MTSPIKSLADRLSDAEEIIRQKNKKLLDAERDLRLRAAEKDSAEKIRTEVFKIAERSPEPPEWLNQAPKAGKSSTGIPLICLNDWHWGEMVDPDQVGGLNAFNRAIGRQRVRTLHNTVNDLCFNHMTNPNYPGAVVAILGDMITGNIHDELRDTNDGPISWSIIEVENQILGLLKSWANKFGKLAVICVPGNHGRNTIKPRTKNKVYESYEWMIYVHIEQYFRNDPRVSVYVPNEVDAHATVFGHRFMFTHGDTLGVKGGDGIIGALGPIARGAMKIGAQQRQAGKDFDTLVIGHYHIYIPRGDATPVLMSPALIGHNEYAHLMLRVRASRPAQALAFVHHKHGFTAQWPMYLDKKVLAPKSEPWFVWGPGRTSTDLDIES